MRLLLEDADIESGWNSPLERSLDLYSQYGGAVMSMERQECGRQEMWDAARNHGLVLRKAFGGVTPMSQQGERNAEDWGHFDPLSRSGGEGRTNSRWRFHPNDLSSAALKAGLWRLGGDSSTDWYGRSRLVAGGLAIFTLDWCEIR